MARRRHNNAVGRAVGLPVIYNKRLTRHLLHSVPPTMAGRIIAIFVTRTSLAECVTCVERVLFAEHFAEIIDAEEIRQLIVLGLSHFARFD